MEIEVEEEKQELSPEQIQELELQEQEYHRQQLEMYRENLSYLRYLQHKIDDSCKVAAMEIGVTVNKYNHFFKEFEPFLRSYAQEHSGVNKKTGEKLKHHRDVEAGAGVFFEGTQRKVTFDTSLIPMLIEQLEAIEDPESEIPFSVQRYIFEKKSYEITDPDGLVAFMKAHEIDPKDFGIVVTEGDAYARMKVGTVAGWTPNKANKTLSDALKIGVQAVEIQEEI
jgi:hypothetical protein